MYINAEKLIAEIERFSSTEYGNNTLGDDVANSALDYVLKEIIPSLQHEQPAMDKDFFFDEVLKVYDENNKYPPRSEEELTMLETIAHHFWNKGYNARKEEMK